MKQTTCLFIFRMVLYIQTAINTGRMIFLLLLFFFSMVQMPVVFGSSDSSDSEDSTDCLLPKNTVLQQAKELTKSKNKTVNASSSSSSLNETGSSSSNSSKNNTNKNNPDLSQAQVDVRELTKKIEKIGKKLEEANIKKLNSTSEEEVLKKKLESITNRLKNYPKGKQNQETPWAIEQLKKNKTSESNHQYHTTPNINTEKSSSNSDDESNNKQTNNFVNNNNNNPKENNNPKNNSGPEPDKQVKNNTTSKPQFKKRYVIIPITLICLYLCYKYIPLKKITSDKKFQNFINSSKSKINTLIDTYSKKTTKVTLADHIDLVEKKQGITNDTKEVIGKITNEGETNIENENSLEQLTKNQNDHSENFELQKKMDTLQQHDDQAHTKNTLGSGNQQKPFGSMQWLGSSFSATFLFLFAGYLLKNPEQGLKKIEKTLHDTYRRYLRYAAAGVALVVSAVLVFGMTQHI